MKYILRHILIYILFAINPAQASGGNINITNNIYLPEPTQQPPVTQIATQSLTTAMDDDLAESIAIAGACGGSFYFGSNRPQMRVDGSIYGGHSKLCIQGAWRPENTPVMFDGGIVPDDDPDKILYRFGALIEF